MNGNAIKKFLEAVENHTLRNVRFYFLSFLAVYAWNTSSLSNIEHHLVSQDKETLTLANKVVYITDDGRVIEAQKQQLDASKNGQFVASVLSNYLIYSRADLTNMYQIKYFTTQQDIVRQNKKMVEFLQDYVFIANPTKEEKATMQKVIDQFDSYARYLFLGLERNAIPHLTNKHHYQIVSYVPKGPNFTIEIRVPSISTSRTNKNAVVTQTGENIIKAEGYFDITKRVNTNYQGMKITNLFIKQVEINHEDKGMETLSTKEKQQ